MKKILFLITFFILSCSKENITDANINNLPYPKYDIKLPTKITLINNGLPSYNREYNFKYDNRNRLITTEVTGEINSKFDYFYDEFQLIKIIVNNTNVYNILYNDSNRLSGVVFNGVTTPIYYNSGTDIYTYESNTFKIKEKDIETYNADRFDLLGTAFWGPFYSVLGYNSFAALLTDVKMLNFATRRPCSNLFHPITHESISMAYSLSGGIYFGGGPAPFADDTHTTLECVFKKTYQYEDIDRL